MIEENSICSAMQINAVDYEAAVDKIIRAAHERKSMGVSALAVHGVMTGVLDSEHGYRLNKLDLVVPDGQPVRWALNLLYGTQLADRVYGPNLALFLFVHGQPLKGYPYIYMGVGTLYYSHLLKTTTKIPGIANCW